MARAEILNAEDINRKVKRMACEILEHNHTEASIILMGISGQGSELSLRLATEMRALSSIPVVESTLFMDKKNPDSPVRISDHQGRIADTAVVLVDDVVNSGRTLMYAASAVLHYRPRKLMVAVMIDRLHRLFPVRADIVGLTLATGLGEYVTVELDNGYDVAWVADK